MCGRFTLYTPSDRLALFFDARVDDESAAVRASYNVAPTNPVMTVIGPKPSDDGKAGGDSRILTSMRWGLVPSWAKDTSIGSRMINARCETVATKPSFRSAFKRRRCLVPADGFFEWKKIEGAKRKTPYYFTRADGEPFAFAGLWEMWSDKAVDDAPVLRTCTIITTDANRDLADVHDRMPVVLESGDWDEWLDTGIDDAEHLQRLLVPARPGLVERREVSTAVNNARSEGPELIEEV